MEMDDLSRVVQGLLAGVGFLCAGSILKGTSGDDVHGLTTAASLWMTAAIGMAAGLGRESTAAVSTLLLLGILALEAPLRRSLLRRHKQVVVPDDR
jgi:putative Mg2+ transporter-C (MgtC) family protein